MKKKSEINIVALAAVVVSLSALFVSVYQTQLQKKQQYASVWPHLTIYNTTVMTDSTFQWTINIANHGVGPAVIREVTYSLNDQKLNGFGQFIQQISGQKSEEIDGYTENLVYEGEFLPQDRNVVAYSTTRYMKHHEAFMKRVESYNIQIRYASVYGEEWEVCVKCADNSKNRKLD